MPGSPLTAHSRPELHFLGEWVGLQPQVAPGEAEAGTHQWLPEVSQLVNHHAGLPEAKAGALSHLRSCHQLGARLITMC